MMFIDEMKGLSKSKSIKLDMYTNIDYNDCKSKYNSLVYLLCHYINENDKSFFSNNREIEKIILNNSEALLLYLFVIKSILSDQQLSDSVLAKKDFSFITILKGTVGIKDVKDKRIILNQIRNAFAHKLGKVYIYNHLGNHRIRIDNKNWFSIDCEIDKLINLFKSALIENNTYISSLINDVIKAVYSMKFNNLNKDTSDILLITLLMCYNKESLMDEFMLTQMAFLDCSKFEIDHKGYKDNYKDFSRNFFDKYDLFFKDYHAKDSYDQEWESLMGNDDTKNNKTTYIYDINNMAYDATTNKHIPTPLFLRNLRDACSHGNIEFKDDKIVFYNTNPKNNPNLKYYMTIKKEDFREFIYSNYFSEGVLTSMAEHAVNLNGKLYNIEQEESAKSFSSYMQIFKNKFPDLTIYELVLYMYKNNKFSTYLLENPENEEEFYRYKIGNNYLWEYIQFLTLTADKDSFVQYFEFEDYEFKTILINYLYDGYSYLHDYVRDFLEDSSVLNDTNNKSIRFFSYYYLFLKNLNSVGVNRKKITEDEIENVKTLRREWFVSNNFHELKMNTLFKTFFAVALQSKHINECNRIVLTTKFNQSVFNKAISDSNEKTSLQPKRKLYKYSPLNVKSIAGVNFIERMIASLGLLVLDNNGMFENSNFKVNYDKYLKRDIKLTDVLTLYLTNKIDGFMYLLEEIDDITDENLTQMSKAIENSVKDKKRKK